MHNTRTRARPRARAHTQTPKITPQIHENRWVQTNTSPRVFYLSLDLNQAGGRALLDKRENGTGLREPDETRCPQKTRSHPSVVYVRAPRSRRASVVSTFAMEMEDGSFIAAVPTTPNTMSLSAHIAENGSTDGICVADRSTAAKNRSNLEATRAGVHSVRLN